MVLPLIDKIDISTTSCTFRYILLLIFLFNSFNLTMVDYKCLLAFNIKEHYSSSK